MILFVTTFDQTLYEHSGKRLLQSFFEKQSWGKILCCHEGFEKAAKVQRLDGVRLIGRDVTLDQNLLDWDAKYRERCDKSLVYWNKRAWQWYRKIVSLRVALETECTDVRWLVWLDCDCEFLCDLTPHVLKDLAKGSGVLYLKGRREWTETGVLAFDLYYFGVRLFLQELFSFYQSGAFLKLERWDDCWVFDKVRNLCGNLGLGRGKMFRDIADPKETDLRVLDSSPLGKYILHKKGSHIRAGVR